MAKVKAQVWAGSESLRALLVPVDSLHREPRNTRLHGDRSLAGIEASYRKFGQQGPIIVLDSGKVIAGNGQHQVAEERLGWTHIAASRFANEALAREFALAHNRSAELSEWNLEELGQELRLLLDTGINLEELGWNAQEVAPLVVAEWAPAEIRELGGEGLQLGQAIRMTHEQRRVFDQAAARMREQDGDLSEGRVVELLAADWLAGV